MMQLTLRPVSMLSVLVSTLGACAAARSGESALNQVAAPGTYGVEICRGPCGVSGEAVLARGFLILEREPYSVSELPDSLREYFQGRTSVLLRSAGGRPNACFVLTRLRSDAGSYAGITPVGLTRVERHGDTLVATLFRSPDASYLVHLKARGRDLRGHGISSGYGDAAVASPDDSVRARRFGAPDRSRCLRAAEVEAAALKARTTRP
jgi:hypothetical protein